MAILTGLFGGAKTAPSPAPARAELRTFLQGYSIEVMPRTAAKVEDFKAILPAETRVYIAHLDGTPIEDMLATAKRIAEDGFAVMPHFPARIIKDQATLEQWIQAYADVGVREALLLGGRGRQAPWRL